MRARTSSGVCDEDAIVRERYTPLIETVFIQYSQLYYVQLSHIYSAKGSNLHPSPSLHKNPSTRARPRSERNYIIIRVSRSPTPENKQLKSPLLIPWSYLHLARLLSKNIHASVSGSLKVRLRSGRDPRLCRVKLHTFIIRSSTSGRGSGASKCTRSSFQTRSTAVIIIIIPRACLAFQRLRRISHRVPSAGVSSSSPFEPPRILRLRRSWISRLVAWTRAEVVEQIIRANGTVA